MVTLVKSFLCTALIAATATQAAEKVCPSGAQQDLAVLHGVSEQEQALHAVRRIYSNVKGCTRDISNAEKRALGRISKAFTS